MKTLIIFDSDHPGAVQNNCFRKKLAPQGYSFHVELANQSIKNGFEIMTGDYFLDWKDDANTKVFCISEMQSKRTDAILKRGAVPFMCICMESPIIARDFYINLERYAGRFVYNMQFKGAASLLGNSKTEVETMYFPVYSRSVLLSLPWKERKYIVLINSNKRAFYNDQTTFKAILRSTLSRIRFSIHKLIYPWMRIPEIYKDRIEAIFYFANRTGFELFGGGWDNKIPGFAKKYEVAAQKSWRGFLKYENKLEEMSRFKFALCFENCAYPGYVTEKIFDCFLSGCIPVYYGAPDIQDFVPADTFIDYKKFKNLESLDEYLSNLKEEDAQSMLNAAKEFLSSKNFDKYFLQNVVSGIIDKINKYK